MSARYEGGQRFFIQPNRYDKQCGIYAMSNLMRRLNHQNDSHPERLDWGGFDFTESSLILEIGTLIARTIGDGYSIAFCTNWDISRQRWERADAAARGEADLYAPIQYPQTDYPVDRTRGQHAFDAFYAEKNTCFRWIQSPEDIVKILNTGEHFIILEDNDRRYALYNRLGIAHLTEPIESREPTPEEINRTPSTGHYLYIYRNTPLGGDPNVDFTIVDSGVYYPGMHDLPFDQFFWFLNDPEGTKFIAISPKPTSESHPRLDVVENTE